MVSRSPLPSMNNTVQSDRRATSCAIRSSVSVLPDPDAPSTSACRASHASGSTSSRPRAGNTASPATR